MPISLNLGPCFEKFNRHLGQNADPSSDTPSDPPNVTILPLNAGQLHFSGNNVRNCEKYGQVGHLAEQRRKSAFVKAEQTFIFYQSSGEFQCRFRLLGALFTGFDCVKWMA